MPRRKAGTPPLYRRHKARGLAVVTIGGKEIYLGRYGTAESKAKYARLIAEYAVTGRAPQPSRSDEDQQELTVAELIALYWKHCRRYYVKDGRPTSEQASIKAAVSGVRSLYGKQPADSFGPLALKAVRQTWIDRGHARRSINQNVGRVVRMFRWATAEELLPPAVHQALAALPGLLEGRSAARETAPIPPVELDVVEATVPHLMPVVADMVRVQMLTGMRPAEVCKLRPCDVDRSRDVWEYVVGGHKTEHHGRVRTVYIGPEAQAVLLPYLLRDADLNCFSPAEAVGQLRERRAAARRTRPSCGNRAGTNRKKNPQRTAGIAYTPNSYRRAIHRACDLAFKPNAPLAGNALKLWQAEHRWSPNRLRHTTGTAIRKRFGLEAAQVILGHAAADVTQVYAERDADKAREVARQVG